MQSKNAIGNLINRYKSVLQKCHLLNTFGITLFATLIATGTTVQAASTATVQASTPATAQAAQTSAMTSTATAASEASANPWKDSVGTLYGDGTLSQTSGSVKLDHNVKTSKAKLFNGKSGSKVTFAGGNYVLKSKSLKVDELDLYGGLDVTSAHTVDIGAIVVEPTGVLTVTADQFDLSGGSKSQYIQTGGVGGPAPIINQGGTVNLVVEDLENFNSGDLSAYIDNRNQAGLYNICTGSDGKYDCSESNVLQVLGLENTDGKLEEKKGVNINKLYGVNLGNSVFYPSGASTDLAYNGQTEMEYKYASGANPNTSNPIWSGSVSIENSSYKLNSIDLGDLPKGTKNYTINGTNAGTYNALILVGNSSGGSNGHGAIFNNPNNLKVTVKGNLTVGDSSGVITHDKPIDVNAQVSGALAAYNGTFNYAKSNLGKSPHPTYNSLIAGKGAIVNLTNHTFETKTIDVQRGAVNAKGTLLNTVLNMEQGTIVAGGFSGGAINFNEDYTVHPQNRKNTVVINTLAGPLVDTRLTDLNKKEWTVPGLNTINSGDTLIIGSQVSAGTGITKANISGGAPFAKPFNLGQDINITGNGTLILGGTSKAFDNVGPCKGGTSEGYSKICNQSFGDLENYTPGARPKMYLQGSYYLSKGNTINVGGPQKSGGGSAATSQVTFGENSLIVVNHVEGQDTIFKIEKAADVEADTLVVNADKGAQIYLDAFSKGTKTYSLFAFDSGGKQVAFKPDNSNVIQGNIYTSSTLYSITYNDKNDTFKIGNALSGQCGSSGGHHSSGSHPTGSGSTPTGPIQPGGTTTGGGTTIGTGSTTNNTLVLSPEITELVSNYVDQYLIGITTHNKYVEHITSTVNNYNYNIVNNNTYVDHNTEYHINNNTYNNTDNNYNVNNNYSNTDNNYNVNNTYNNTDNKYNVNIDSNNNLVYHNGTKVNINDKTVNLTDSTTIRNDGHTVINNKTITPTGAVVHSSGSTTTQSGTSHPGGSITLHTDTSHPGGVLHPDGTITHNGSIIHPDGTKTKIDTPIAHPSGSITNPDGTVTHSDGSTTKADGSVHFSDGTHVQADGTTIHTNGATTTSDGTTTHADGSVTYAGGTTEHADGSVTYPGGITLNPDGSVVNSEGVTTDIYGNIKPPSQLKNNQGVLTAAEVAKNFESAWRMTVLSGVVQNTFAASSESSHNISRRLGLLEMASNDSFIMTLDNASANAADVVDEEYVFVEEDITVSSSPSQGLSVWFQPLYQHLDAHNLDFGTGFDYGLKSNLWGGTVGVDYTFPSNMVLGIAAHAGGGESESTGNDFFETKNDYSYVGGSLYGGYVSQNMSHSASISYTGTNNEVTQNTSYSHDLTSNFDSYIISGALRSEYLYRTNYVDIRPHAGVIVNYFKTEDSNLNFAGTTSHKKHGSSMTNFEIPVGVTFQKEFTPASDFIVKPKLDVGVLFTAGDRHYDEKTGLTNVNGVSSLEGEVFAPVTFQAGVGLDVQKDNFILGVDYRLNTSNKGMSHQVRATVEYTF